MTAKYANGVLELWNLSDGSGSCVRCHRNGNIELFEIPLCGDERSYGNYPTVCAALDEAATWT